MLEMGSVCSLGDAWEWDVGVGAGVDGVLENRDGSTSVSGTEVEGGAERGAEGVAAWNDPVGDFADNGRLDMGVHGDTGVGVDNVRSSSGGGERGDAPSTDADEGDGRLPFAPGSKNEKKLCDMECLWWCPRLAVEPDDEDELDLVINSGAPVGSDCLGGLPPNVKPTPMGVGGPAPLNERVRDAGKLMLGLLADGMTETGAGASSSTRSSRASDMEEAPGLGKKTDRFRECRRACLRELGWGIWSGGGWDWKG